MEESKNAEVEELRKAVKKLEEESKIGGTASVASSSTLGPTREAEYSRARRSIRMWPVKEKDGLDLWGAAATFVHECLKVPRTDLAKEDIEFVSKAPIRRRRYKDKEEPGLVSDEVIVRFKTKETRHLVMAHSYNLAPFTNDHGKPTAGVRLEIPAHLSAEFQDFQIYGRTLHAKYGKGFKRYIKFDDKEEKLFMQIRLPEEEELLLVDRDMAVENRRERTSKIVASTRKRLASRSANDGEVVVIGTGGNAEPLPKVSRSSGGTPSSAAASSSSPPKSSTLAKYRGKPAISGWEWE